MRMIHRKLKNVISSLNETIEKLTFFCLGKSKPNIPEKPRPVKMFLTSQLL